MKHIFGELYTLCSETSARADGDDDRGGSPLERDIVDKLASADLCLNLGQLRTSEWMSTAARLPAGQVLGG